MIKLYALLDHEGNFRSADGCVAKKPKLWQSKAQPHAGITNGRSKAKYLGYKSRYINGKWETKSQEDLDKEVADELARVNKWEIVEYLLVEVGRMPAAGYIPEER